MLPITKIEVVTLAYATLNFATYALWWHKPLNVQCPFRVLRKQQQGEGGGGQIQDASEEKGRDGPERWDMFEFKEVVRRHGDEASSMFKFGVAVSRHSDEGSGMSRFGVPDAITVLRRLPATIVHRTCGAVAVACSIGEAIVRGVDYVRSNGGAQS